MNLMPIGTVVQLKNAEKSLMIIGILQRNGDGKLYDYIACPYPEGYLNAEQLFLFQTGDVDKIKFLGFTDIERQAYMAEVEKSLNENKDNN